jgi:hypothetical protein
MGFRSRKIFSKSSFLTSYECTHPDKRNHNHNMASHIDRIIDDAFQHTSVGRIQGFMFGKCSSEVTAKLSGGPMGKGRKAPGANLLKLKATNKIYAGKMSKCLHEIGVKLPHRFSTQNIYTPQTKIIAPLISYYIFLQTTGASDVNNPVALENYCT